MRKLGFDLVGLARAFVVAAFALGAAAPPGTMPVRLPDGTIMIELCSGEGPARLALGPDSTVTPLPDEAPDRAADCSGPVFLQAANAPPAATRIEPAYGPISRAQIVRSEAPPGESRLPLAFRSRAPPVVL
jgi:hypothetical protein